MIYEGRARMRRCDVGGSKGDKVRILSHTYANNLIGIYLTIQIHESYNCLVCQSISMALQNIIVIVARGNEKRRAIT